jgi:hypothetical protein
VDQEELSEWMQRSKLHAERFQARVAEETTPAALAKKIAQATGSLTFLDDTCPVIFRDRTYRWVGVKRFYIDDTLTAGALLAALLMHSQYRDTFLTVDSVTSDPIHGPFDLERIAPANFESVDPPRAILIFREWANEYGPAPSDEIEGDIGLIEALIEESDSRYFLPDLGESARHEFGWMLPRFKEFVLISRRTRELHLVVLTDD